MPAGFNDEFATGLKECVSHIFSGNDGQGKQPGFTHQGPGQLNTSNENAPYQNNAFHLKNRLLSYAYLQKLQKRQSTINPTVHTSRGRAILSETRRQIFSPIVDFLLSIS